ncbi:MAG: integrase arm-type DNA-binding domain-containing protein [Candidatus Obscuribacterales bacterium]|nr:integrase arm-type DNA-binding domain-containing protein [Candidatus Obscuribacterales bacterium]
MPKLTKAFIESLSRPERGQLIVRDEVLPGFGVRLTPNCISFVAEGRMAGKAKRLTVGKFPQLSVEDARSEAREILIDMAAGVERRAEPSVLT